MCVFIGFFKEFFVKLRFRISALALVVLALSYPIHLLAAQEKKPNIILVISDDHAYQAIGAYGSVINKTPNIDKLASQGMRFDRAFVTNSLCGPSRAVILTGKHSHLNGLHRNNGTAFDGSQQTFPKLLHENGYQTAIVGKWHLKSDPTGFDYWRVLPGQGNYYHPEFRTPDGIVKKQGHATDITTDIAINWLDKKRDKSKPFMMVYSHKAPHRPWWPSQEHLTDFKDVTISEPATLFDDYNNRGTAAKTAEMRISTHMSLSSDNKIDPDIVKKMGHKEFRPGYPKGYKDRYQRLSKEEKKQWDNVYKPISQKFVADKLQGDELTKWKYQRYMQDYLASINSLDENVGRLLDYLDENKLTENTMVIYTSDQGFYLGEHGWFDKRFMYEQSLRTPLIVRWPGKVDAGTVNNDMVQNLDYAQTILDAAGVNVPSDMQGKSILPLLQGEDVAWRKAIFYHYYDYPSIHMVKRHYGIRTTRYKLIHFYHDIDEWELYDLEEDPDEMNNLINDKQYTQIKKELTR
jgi:arylsulfatase A-like enzyme